MKEYVACENMWDCGADCDYCDTCGAPPGTVSEDCCECCGNKDSVPYARLLRSD